MHNPGRYLRQMRSKLYKTAAAAHASLVTKGYSGSLDRYRRLERGEAAPDYKEMQIICSELGLSLDAWIRGSHIHEELAAAVKDLSEEDIRVASGLLVAYAELIKARSATE